MSRIRLSVLALFAASLGGCSSFSDITGSFGSSPRPQADMAGGGDFVAEPRVPRRIRPLAPPPEPSFAAPDAAQSDDGFAAPIEPVARRTTIRPIEPTREVAAIEAPTDEPAAEPAAPAPRKRLGFMAARDEINAYREAEGLPPLAMDDDLMRAAKAQSDAMARSDSMDHSVGGSFARRMAKVGVEDVPAAENIAAGYASASAVIRGWKASPAHDANLRMKEATRLGIAASPSQSNPKKLYWTLIVAGS
jgi:uncharacterized protein YkwD